MPTLAIPSPDPFARIVAISLEESSRYQFRIIRDDGVTYSPQSEENLTLTLTSPTDEPIFTGQSQTQQYIELIEGLITHFSYQSGYYHLELDQELLEEFYHMGGSDMRCYLTTKGAKTLETTHSRAYHPEASPSLLAPGSYEVTVPYWHETTQTLYPTPTTSQKRTIFTSSVPYRAYFELLEALPLATFNFPILGIIWIPTPDLMSWSGIFDIREVCVGGTLIAPNQYPEGISQPAQPPSSHSERRYVLYYDILLKISLSPCPGEWSEISASLDSDFGFSCQLPYIRVLKQSLNTE
jgi:hypothetical protein